ncbi:MAG: mannose-1-phosphate guanylyltransferase [Candidatus Kerfeldbacteria bacterium]|nr:mannose-1-phosphate guanylyltransferase [Candidatus Kerfeldbacteria bacterium]
MYAVIRAGGVGARLWPISRNAKPKQFHALTSQKTLLQEAIDRVLDLIPPEQVFVSCNSQTEAILRAELGAVLEHNIIVEPDLRDTAAAVGLETIMIAKHDPQAIIASLGSDHVITDSAEFQRILRLAETTIQAQPDKILCIGINPTQPDTGYGYIELGEPVTEEVYQVKSFKEKPVEAVAKQFLAAGNYLWNGNMFMWRADTLLKLFQQHMPAMYAQLCLIQEQPARLAEIYPQLEKVAIDYALIEKTKDILAIPGNFGWNDIGDWARLKDELVPIEADNYSKGDHFDLGSKNTLVFSETKRFIATVNTKDLIIVDTEDGLLVCDKFSSQQVKDIVEELKKRKRTALL